MIYVSWDNSGVVVQNSLLNSRVPSIPGSSPIWTATWTRTFKDAGSCVTAPYSTLSLPYCCGSTSITSVSWEDSGVIVHSSSPQSGITSSLGSSVPELVETSVRIFKDVGSCVTTSSFSSGFLLLKFSLGIFTLSQIDSIQGCWFLCDNNLFIRNFFLLQFFFGSLTINNIEGC